jgi:hypothetical protein
MLNCAFDHEVLDAVRIIAKKLNLPLVDNTGRGGAFWIICGYEWATMFAMLGMQFSPTGGSATHRRPAWFGNLPPSASSTSQC